MRGSTTQNSQCTRAGKIAERYIELLRKALLNETCLEAEAAYFYARECAEKGAPFDLTRMFNVQEGLAGLYSRLASARRIGRHLNRDLQKIGFSTTMIGRKRMENLEQCVRDVVENDVRGDLIECGVWRGGATIFMRGILAALGVTDRLVWVADSFRGLPDPNPERMDPDLAASRLPQLAVDLAQVKENFVRYDLLDAQVCFLEGLFEDTLPRAPIHRLAVLRLDGDYYDSTMDPLKALYDKVSVGGYVIVDDYGVIPACQAAVDDFRAERSITSVMELVDTDCVFWKKSADEA